MSINVCAGDAHVLGGIPVVADARRALETLDTELAGWRVPEPHADRVAAALDRWQVAVRGDLAPRVGERMSQAQVVRCVNAAARRGDWVVAAAGSPPGDLLKLWEVPEGGAAHLEFGFSCMGHELPAGIGIRLADDEAGEIVVVIGDGTFLMSPTELATAVQERAKVTVVVLVNSGWQSIHALQLATVGDSFGNEFRVRDRDAGAPCGEVLEVDHASLARALGAAAWRATTIAELERALEAARAEQRPALIECHVEPRRMTLGSGAWWDLGVASQAESATTRDLAARHVAGNTAQRFFG